VLNKFAMNFYNSKITGKDNNTKLSSINITLIAKFRNRDSQNFKKFRWKEKKWLINTWEKS